MLGRNHILAATSATIGAVYFGAHHGWIHPTLATLALAVPTGATASLLPDVDHPKSFAGRASVVGRFPWIFGCGSDPHRHRGWPHSLLTLGLILVGIAHPMGLGVLLGLLTSVGLFAFSRLIPESSGSLGRRIRRVGPVIAAPIGSLVGYLAVIDGVHVGTWFPIAVCTGFLSHLATDSLNPEGVMWLWPLRWRFRIPLFKVGGWFERWVVTLTLVGGLIATVTFVARPMVESTQLPAATHHTGLLTTVAPR